MCSSICGSRTLLIISRLDAGKPTFEHRGTTYHFCCARCRDRFAADPAPYLDKTIGEPCPYPFQRLNIDSRGKVEVCGFDISGRTNLGNVRTQTIREIWQGPMFQWWREKHAEGRGGDIPLCRECPDWQYRSWTHNWEKVMRTANTHRLRVIEWADSEKSGSTPS